METRQFASNTLTAYLKGEVSQPNANLINVKIPNSIGGIIPLGCKSTSVSVSHIASVGTNFCVNIVALLSGIIAGIFSLILTFLCIVDMFKGDTPFGEVLFFFVIFVLSVSVTLDAPRVYLSIRDTSGQVVGSQAKVDKNGKISNDGIPFIIFHKKIAEAIAADLNKLVGQRAEDTNVRIQNKTVIAANAENTSAIIDAINNIGNKNE